MTLKDALKNSKGQIFYGMHFYPGVARYEQPGQETFTVFINENTIRKMGPSFSGRPIFVEHVDEVEESLSELREEADGWVIESFFNQADGKTWAKFIVVSERGLQAISKGWRLSNAYIPKAFGPRGCWNGVDYEKEVTDGEFEHLAIVQNPRYEESVILTPEQFKEHNEKQTVELKRLSNSKKEKGDSTMKLNIFKRTKVENSMDLDGLVVELPKSKKEILLTKVVNEYDAILNMNGYANGDHMVKVGEDEMSVNDLVKKHLETQNEMAKMKAEKDNGEDDMEEGDMSGDEDDGVENETEQDIEDKGVEDVGDRGGDKHLSNEDEEDEDDKKKDKKVKNAAEAKRLAKEKALRLKNAHNRQHEEEEVARIALPGDQVARGKQLYGSGN